MLADDENNDHKFVDNDYNAGDDEDEDKEDVPEDFLRGATNVDRTSEKITKQ